MLKFNDEFYPEPRRFIIFKKFSNILCFNFGAYYFNDIIINISFFKQQFKESFRLFSILAYQSDSGLKCHSSPKFIIPPVSRLMIDEDLKNKEKINRYFMLL